jgi:chromosome segregation ATPase
MLESEQRARRAAESARDALKAELDELRRQMSSQAVRLDGAAAEAAAERARAVSAAAEAEASVKAQGELAATQADLERKLAKAQLAEEQAAKDVAAKVKAHAKALVELQGKLSAAEARAAKAIAMSQTELAAAKESHESFKAAAKEREQKTKAAAEAALAKADAAAKQAADDAASTQNALYLSNRALDEKLKSTDAELTGSRKREADLAAEVSELRKKLSSFEFMAAFTSEKKLNAAQNAAGAMASKASSKPGSSWSTQLEAKENAFTQNK